MPEANVECTLGDIAKAIVDCEHKSAPTQQTGIPLIRTTDIKKGRLDLKSAHHVSEKTFRIWSSRIVPMPDDLVLAREAPVGEVGIVPKNEQICLGQRTTLLRIDKQKADPRYILYLLCTPKLKHEMTSRAAGSVVQHLNVQNIRFLPIPKLPDLSEQKKISSILGSLDDKTVINEKTCSTLHGVSEEIFKHWFIDFEFPNEEGKPYKSSSGEMTDSKLGKIPRNWKVGKISDYCTTQYGFTASATGEEVGPKFLRITDMNKHAWIDWAKIPHCEIGADLFPRYKLSAGDILVSRMADPGKAAIVEDDVNAVFASYLIRLKTSTLGLAYYLFYFLRSSLYLNYVEGAKSGSVQSNMNAKVITSADVFVPPDDLLERFQVIVSPLRKRIVQNLHESNTLSSVRDYLLPRLMSGKIRVPVETR